MKHRHLGKYRSRTPRGRITYKYKPIHKHIKRHRPVIRRMAWDLRGAEEDLHKIEYMSPEEYLKRTGTSLEKFEGDPSWSGKYHDIEKDESRPIEELGEYIKDPDKRVTIPEVGDNPRDHEGRHRAYAAMLKGQEEIPVIVPLERSERKELAEEFIQRAIPHSGKDYQDEWRERFESGFPESHMTSDNLKVYKGILEERDIEEPD